MVRASAPCHALQFATAPPARGDALGGPHTHYPPNNALSVDAPLAARDEIDGESQQGEMSNDA